MALKFSHKIPALKKISSRNKFLSELVKGKKVLHGGCVDSGLLTERLNKKELLHNILTENAAEVVGVDVDEEGINQMAEMGFNNVFYADLETWSYEGKFDVIVLGEIIEHIDNCGLFLKTIQRFCTEETKVIITTPNAFYYLFWLYTLVGKESIHPDHNYLFSFNSLKFLLAKFGFEVLENIILWEPISFVNQEDGILIKAGKSIVAIFVNSLILLKYIMPQYGKSIIMVVRPSKNN